LYHFHRHFPVFFHDNVLEDVLGHEKGDFLARKAGVCAQTNKHPFQFPYVARGTGSEEEGHVVGNVYLVHIGFSLKDGHFGFDVRRLDIRNQTPFET